jgi:hypothetical protein
MGAAATGKAAENSDGGFERSRLGLVAAAGLSRCGSVLGTPWAIQSERQVNLGIWIPTGGSEMMIPSIDFECLVIVS